jgi:hypothetical protein
MLMIIAYFQIERTSHSGPFDFLTLMVYRRIVGTDNASEAGGFHVRWLARRSSQYFDLGMYARVMR